MMAENMSVNLLNAELNPICHLLVLVGTDHILQISRVRVNDFIIGYDIVPPIPISVLSKSWVCGRSVAGIVVSNTAGLIDVSVVIVVCC